MISVLIGCRVIHNAAEAETQNTWMWQEWAKMFWLLCHYKYNEFLMSFFVNILLKLAFRSIFHYMGIYRVHTPAHSYSCILPSLSTSDMSLRTDTWLVILEGHDWNFENPCSFCTIYIQGHFQLSRLGLQVQYTPLEINQKAVDPRS